VIKLEEPKGGDIARVNMRDQKNSDSLFFLILNANKRSLTLNLKTDAGKDLFRKVIAQSDVLLRPASSRASPQSSPPKAPPLSAAAAAHPAPASKSSPISAASFSRAALFRALLFSPSLRLTQPPNTHLKTITTTTRGCG
jgi:hypothetical protein